MSDGNGYSSGHLLWAFLGGAAAGAGVALLMAPRSGEETRKMIGDYGARGKRTVARIPEASRQASQAAKESFSEAMEEES